MTDMSSGESSEVLTPWERQQFASLAKRLEGDAEATDGWDTWERPLPEGLEGGVPLGHIAFQGDFESPRPEA